MRKKLRSSKGMTLTELIVALAIVSLIGAALTVGINGASKVYRDSTQLYESETLCGTILTYLEDEFRFSRNIRTETVGTETKVVFDSKTFGNGVQVKLDDDGKILIGKETGPGSELLGASAYTSGLKVWKCEVKKSEEGSNQVIITVAVGPKNRNDYVEHSVEVAPVDS